MKHSTQGITFIKHSLGAFNGSGYADMSSGQAYLDSFQDYNEWRQRKEQQELTEQYYDELLPIADYLVKHSHGAGRKPSQKNLDRFAAFRNKDFANLDNIKLFED